MRNTLILLLILCSVTGFAQDTKPVSNSKIRLFSSLGIGMIDKAFEPASGNSIQTATGIELQFSPHSSLAGTVMFDSYRYQLSGPSYQFDGKLKTTGIGLFYRYTLGQSALRPYLKVGGGGAWLMIPTIRVEQGSTIIKNKTEFVGLALAEVGLMTRILQRYSLFLGAERNWLAESSVLNASLRTANLKIGLISEF